VVGHRTVVRPQQIAGLDPMTREVHKMLAELAHPPDEGEL
jgi:hypothetical protein